MAKSRLVIYVEDGNVVGVRSDSDIEVIMHDKDNIDAGDEPGLYHVNGFNKEDEELFKKYGGTDNG